MTQSYSNAVFISDLHLTQDRPDTIRAFFDFLQDIPSNTEALFILGDFFEYWVGDDIESNLSLSISEALNKLRQRLTVDIYFLPGNRDFSIGKRYCNQSSMTLISDDTLFLIAGHKVLVSHGDLYCTDDKSYQRFRKIIRHPVILKALLSLSKKRRIKIAEKLRRNSKDKFRKYPISVDVNLSTVTEVFRETQADVIIHGHTHIADIHAHDIESNMKSRMVLGDWHDYGWFGHCDESGVTLNKFPIKNVSS